MTDRSEDEMPGALDGLRIIDLSWGIAGPLGVLLLAEQGADVIKVEPPAGDPFRTYTGWSVWNRSRRSVRADLTRVEGREALHALCASADVLVESFRPGVTARLGVAYEDLRAANPRLVYCSCPAYPDGHRFAQRPGYDALVQASSGQQWEQPGWRPGPIFLAMPMPSMGAAMLVPTGILAALCAREVTGEGQLVRTSLFQGALLYTTQIWQYVENSDAAFHELMGKSYPPGIHQQFVYEVAHGEYVHTSVMSGQTPVRSQDEILGLADAPDPFTFMAMPADEREAFNARRRAAYREHERDALVAEMQENLIAVEAVVSAEESLGARGRPHPQLLANGMVAHVADPTQRDTVQMGVPIHLMGTPGAIRGGAPALGAHDAEVWGALGYGPDEIAVLTGAGQR